MLLGRLSSLLQSFKFSNIRLLRSPIEEGSSLIPVLSKQSSFRHSISPTISGILSIFEQPERINVCRDPFPILDGKILRSKSTIPVPSRIKLSRFGAILKSGVFTRFLEPLRSTNFNLSKAYKRKQ
ncbi:hypothetical protein V6Z11_D01G066400 [Gossypium hirsutum]